MLFSEPKIPQSAPSSGRSLETTTVSVLFSEPKIPQSYTVSFNPDDFVSFSALQRAENSSIQFFDVGFASTAGVSVLFSEPKIPQSDQRAARLQRVRVSVLFSEPKIPQWRQSGTKRRTSSGFSALQRAENSSMTATAGASRSSTGGFSALQRAENSSIVLSSVGRSVYYPFQCSSASRKFLN